MLIHAFAGEILDRVKIEPLRVALEAELYAQLAQGPRGGRRGMTTTAAAATAAVRAAFDVAADPAPTSRFCAQRVHGKPLVYLDNAATTQKPQAVLDALTRYYTDDQRQRAPRRPRAERAATDAYEAARDEGPRVLQRRARSARSSSRGTPPRASTWWRTRFGRPTLRPGDEVLISAMEHHSNIVPWQLRLRGARRARCAWRRSTIAAS